MMKRRFALPGSAVIGAALLCVAGVAQAQDYDSPNAGYRADERVSVHPEYRVEKRQLAGRIDGSANPVQLSISHPVSFSDLNLSQSTDRIALHQRVRDTARELCFELNARFPELRGAPSEDQECIRKATQTAMRDVTARFG